MTAKSLLRPSMLGTIVFSQGSPGSPSHRHGVVGRKQAARTPQPPLPPGGVGAVQHFDDVAHAEAQLVVLLRCEVVQRPHLQGGGPLCGRTHRNKRQSEAAWRCSWPQVQKIYMHTYKNRDCICPYVVIYQYRILHINLNIYLNIFTYLYTYISSFFIVLS